MAAAVFDLDGTLMHTAPGVRSAVNRMIASYDAEPLSLDVVTGFIGHGVPALVRQCLQAIGAPESEQERALASFIAIYGPQPWVETEVFVGVEDLLRRLSDRGWRLGVCTNKLEAPARRLLRFHGLEGYFPSVVGGDRLATKKPDPAPLILCLSEIGATAREAVFVGDSRIDAETASAAGVSYYHFAGGYGSLGPDVPATVFRSFPELSARLTPDGAE